jgi:hypothetical protein
MDIFSRRRKFSVSVKGSENRPRTDDNTVVVRAGVLQDVFG